jgi:hypothetical protein
VAHPLCCICMSSLSQLTSFFRLQSHKSFFSLPPTTFPIKYQVSKASSYSAMSVLSPSRLRARIAPHLTLRVPFKAGMYENSPRWSNKDLDPVPPELRTWGGLVSQVHRRSLLPALTVDSRTTGHTGLATCSHLPWPLLSALSCHSVSLLARPSPLSSSALPFAPWSSH